MKVWTLEVYEGDVEDTYGTGSWYLEGIFYTEEAAFEYRWENFPAIEERNVSVQEREVNE